MFTIPIEVPIAWGCFASYALWYIAAAKHAVPISLDEAKVLWKIHKQNTNYTCRKWQPSTVRSGKITGFKCECGYKYTQERHVLSREFKHTKQQKLQTTAKASTTRSPLSNQSIVSARTSRKSQLNTR